MKYPSLVRKQECKTDIHVVLYSDDISEEGAPQIALDSDFKCNYQNKAKRVLTSEKVSVQVTGTCLFHEDIAPDITDIHSGKVTIFGKERDIIQGIKARNPDGTVNYVQLDIV